VRAASLCSPVTRPRAHLLAALAAFATVTPALASAPAEPPSSAAAPQPSASQTAGAPAPADEAAVLFKKAVAAHEAGQLAEAEELFSKAWALKKTWDIAANLGLVAGRLGKHVAAAELLAQAARLLPPIEGSGTAAQLAKQLAAARAEVVAVKVRANVDGAEVRGGGEMKGHTPLESEVFVAPGTVTIEVKKDGYETVTQTLAAKKGDTKELSFALVVKQNLPPERSMAPPAIAFGVGGAGLILGAVAGGIATGQMDELRKKCGREFVCPEGARAEADAATTASRISTAGLVVAGLGAAVGATLLLISGGKKAPPRAALQLGPGFAGVKGVF
jgi:hypothetical protein